MSVAHHDERRAVKTIYQQSRFLIDGQVVRPQNATHTLIAQPGFGGLQKGCKGIGVVFGFDHSEKTFIFLIAIQVKLINLGADAAHRLAVAIGHPRLVAGMRKIRIVRR